MHNTESILSISDWHHGLTYTDVRIRDFVLDDSLPKLQCNDHIPIPPNVDHDLGTLNTLPLKLLHEIIWKLDLCTLTDFRHIN